MVVWRGGRTVNQLFAAGAGDFPDPSARRSWRPLITSFGYSHRLCDGGALTPAIVHREHDHGGAAFGSHLTFANLGRTARLWAIVLAANLAGTLFAAVFCAYTPVLTPEVYGGMLSVSQRLLDFSWWDMLFRAIAAGFLMAAMVWLMPGAERSQFQVIVLMTWLIALGGFTHVVAGSMEAYLLVFSGSWAWWQMLVQFMAPVLIGNIIGGTAICADFLCPGYGRDLSRLLKQNLNLRRHFKRFSDLK